MTRQQQDYELDAADESTSRAIREIMRSVMSVNYGSVEIVIHNSRIVQIERKEKFRFDRD
jgi:hypothetical protein